jgi:ribonucleoside-diphosphate reductase alpha chain
MQNFDVSSVQTRATSRPNPPKEDQAQPSSSLSERKQRKDTVMVDIQHHAGLIFEDPSHSKIAAQKLSAWISEEVSLQGIMSFKDSLMAGRSHGLVNERLMNFAEQYCDVLNAAIIPEQDYRFEYFGIRTIYDRYLLKHPHTREVIETPQYFFMRVACALSQTLEEAIELYGIYSSFEFMSSSPTLFNAGTTHEQLSSCFLLDSPEDSLLSIYDKYKDAALLSKFSGGIGLSYSRVRSRGSLIKSTNGFSNGVIPWLKTLDSSVNAVNQGGKRKGACCVYLETWHADIEEFLELRENTGDEARRAHNLNLANWIPDLFMKRVADDQTWSLFDPAIAPELVDLYGKEFEEAYLALEKSGKFTRQVKARDLYARMMRTLAQTGNGWMTFKDASNQKCNQTALKGRTVHLSNLCTEIIEVTNKDETAVCNLGSINLSAYVEKDKTFNWSKLTRNVKIAIRHLDRVIDLNFYPIPTAKSSNMRWRPVGLGVMGLQDVYFLMGWPFDCEAARAFNKKVQEEIYLAALTASVELAEQLGAHDAFAETRAARGELQFDSWGVSPSSDKAEQWNTLRSRIMKSGLRNSLLLAIAPTATIGSIVGSYECIEPQVSNLFKRETLSGEFLQVNRYLVSDLKARGLWNDDVRSKIKMAEGSVQTIEEVPADLKAIYRTAWEIPMRSLIDMAADRGAFLDQSQSLNLFVESPNIGVLSSMYMYAWKKGLKTTYYLRSRPATRIAKVNVDTTVGNPSESPKKSFTPEQALACSLENPEACEACQ